MSTPRWLVLIAIIAPVLFGTGCPTGPGGGGPVPDAADHFFVDLASGRPT